MRLVDGDNYNATAGRVEYCVGGRWGTVCDYKWRSWSKVHADVVCRQLGLSTHRKTITIAHNHYTNLTVVHTCVRASVCPESSYHWKQFDLCQKTRFNSLHLWALTLQKQSIETAGNEFTCWQIVTSHMTCPDVHMLARMRTSTTYCTLTTNIVYCIIYTTKGSSGALGSAWSSAA